MLARREPRAVQARRLNLLWGMHPNRLGAMTESYEPLARAYLQDLYATHGWPTPPVADEVRRLVLLFSQAVAQERQACAEIAEEVMRLRGSEAAEIIAGRVRARGQGEDR
jgi:hypothetical protein